MKKEKLKKGLNILELLSTNNITSSKSEARRAIKGNAIKLDNEVLLDENKLISIKDFKNENVLKISFGKKKHYLIKNYLAFFDLSNALVIKRGVKVLIGLIDVFIFPGGPFILKLTPNKPSPTSFGIIMSPITGIF